MKYVRLDPEGEDFFPLLDLSYINKRKEFHCANSIHAYSAL
jgi:hypothetical protein